MVRELLERGRIGGEQHSVMGIIAPSYRGISTPSEPRCSAGASSRESDDAAHEHVAIIDDALAQELWPNEEAIGKKLNVSDSPKGAYQFERDWAVVVRVVKHIQCHSLTVMVRPQIYVPYQLARGPSLLLSTPLALFLISLLQRGRKSPC